MLMTCGTMYGLGFKSYDASSKPLFWETSHTLRAANSNVSLSPARSLVCQANGLSSQPAPKQYPKPNGFRGLGLNRLNIIHTLVQWRMLPVTARGIHSQSKRLSILPIGPKVVPFWGFLFRIYKVIPKRNYFGAYG